MPDVLVADDDPGGRAVLTAAFEAAGYTVRQAGDGTAALRAIDEAAPDCLVVDLGLPVGGEAGVAALRHRLAVAPIRVVVVSTNDEPDRFLGSWRLGADHYCPKPFEPSRLLRKVDELVRTPIEVLRHRREELVERAELLDRLQATFG